MPKGPTDIKGEFVNLLVADKFLNSKNIKIARVKTLLTPYMTSEEYQSKYLFNRKQQDTSKDLYGHDLFEEIHRYAARVQVIAQTENFDIIHAHDWMTYPAGIEAQKITGKPLVVHIHATSFDRAGGQGINQYVYDIEKTGFNEANKILAVSNYTKNLLVKHYGINPDKIRVVHNAVEFAEVQHHKIEKDDKIVLFLGRITIQKGPDYFLEAAKKVLDMDKKVKFIFAGSGDMEARMIERTAELGIANKVLFAGFLKGEDVNKAYQMADVYVMPSVSEPFGITPLEAMKVGTPVIISKQSGVSEVVHHVLKVDFWDVNDMANKIMAILHYKSLTKEIKRHGTIEVNKFNWNIPAKKCIEEYEALA